MPPVRTEIRSGDGTPIPVWTSGQGTALLIVHGAAGTHETWEMMRPLLEDRFAVSIMDRRVTLEDPFATLEIETEFDDVAAVANSLDGPVVLLGHSSGAQCALGAAPKVHDLKQLLLYEPPLDLDQNSPHYREVLPQLEERLRAGDFDGVFDTWLRAYVRMPEVIAEAVKASPIGESLVRYAKYLPREMAAHLNWTIDETAISSIQAPTTYLVGSQTPEQNVELRGFIPILERNLSRFQVREIPDQGHFANFLDPGLLADLIAEVI